MKYISFLILFFVLFCNCTNSHEGLEVNQPELDSDIDNLVQSIYSTEYCDIISRLMDYMSDNSEYSDALLKDHITNTINDLETYTSSRKISMESLNDRLNLVKATIFQNYQCRDEGELQLRLSYEASLKLYQSWGLYGFGNAGVQFPRDCNVQTCCEKAICEYTNCRDAAIWHVISNAGSSAAQIIVVATIVSYYVATGNVGLLTQRVVSILNAVLGTAEGFAELFVQCPEIWDTLSSECNCECPDSPQERICYPAWSTTDAWFFPC